MGKGTILSASGSTGRYNLKLNYATERLEQRVSQLQAQAVALGTELLAAQAALAAEQAVIDYMWQSVLSAPTDEIRKEREKRYLEELPTLRGLQAQVKGLTLEKASCEKSAEYLSTFDSQNDPTVTLWCADYSVPGAGELTGEVGMIELPGQRRSTIIRPGFNGRATYNAARDGQLWRPIAMSPAQCWYNSAIMPGAERWIPQYRVGYISAFNGGDTCTVDLDSAASRVQNLNVNPPVDVLSNVAIEYMDCNGAAFELGDRVVVEFSGDWDTPKVIGFESEPKPCKPYVVVTYLIGGGENLYMVWDPSMNDYAEIFDPSTGLQILQPCTESELSAWLALRNDIDGWNTLWETDVPPYCYTAGDPVGRPCDVDPTLDDCYDRQEIDGTTYICSHGFTLNLYISGGDLLSNREYGYEVTSFNNGHTVDTPSRRYLVVDDYTSYVYFVQRTNAYRIRGLWGELQNVGPVLGGSRDTEFGMAVLSLLFAGYYHEDLKISLAVNAAFGIQNHYVFDSPNYEYTGQDFVKFEAHAHCQIGQPVMDIDPAAEYGRTTEFEAAMNAFWDYRQAQSPVPLYGYGATGGESPQLLTNVSFRLVR